MARENAPQSRHTDIVVDLKFFPLQLKVPHLSSKNLAWYPISDTAFDIDR
jgi:hypothetical protein